jgi:hypothetical protein
VKEYDVTHITFNSSNLLLHEDRVSLTSQQDQGEQTHNVLIVNINEEAERVSIQTPPPSLSKYSKAKLRIGYEGHLTGSMMGASCAGIYIIRD